MNEIDADLAKFALDHQPIVDRHTAAGRAALDKKTIHISNVLEDVEYRWHGREGQKVGKFRTLLGVPLLRDDEPFGAFVLWRTTVRAFSDKEIELVTSFANQAVIAIQNVLLFEAEQTRTRELSEALEQQTATSEVLSVISSSPGELEPVFQAMLENATRICEAKFGVLFREPNVIGE